MGINSVKELVKNRLPDRVVESLRSLKGHVLSRNQAIGMTSKTEQEFFRKCTRELSHLDGAIVDLGCWMGSTSIALAQGIRENKTQNSRQVYAYDQFIWEDWMAPYQSIVKKTYKEGDSFLDEVQWRTRRYSRIVKLVTADLSTYKWNDGPINILLVDAMKNWQLARSILDAFFPHIKKGGVLIHQDFKHFYTPWIHILQYRLRDFFELMEDVPNGATVAFKCVRQVTHADVQSATNFSQVSKDQLRAVFNYSMDCVNDHQKSAVAAAHIMYFVHKGLYPEANHVLEDYSGKGLIETIDFQLAEKEARLASRNGNHV